MGFGYYPYPISSPVRSLRWLFMQLFSSPARSPLKPLSLYEDKGFATLSAGRLPLAPQLLSQGYKCLLAGQHFTPIIAVFEVVKCRASTRPMAFSSFLLPPPHHCAGALSHPPSAPRTAYKIGKGGGSTCIFNQRCWRAIYLIIVETPVKLIGMLSGICIIAVGCKMFT